MRQPTSVHDLRMLIRSFHPLIAIESVEEERLDALLTSVADQERMPLFEWSVTRGLTRADETLVNRTTAPPLALLQHLHGLKVEAVYWLKDLAPHLQDNAVARQLREVGQHFGQTRATCVMTGASIVLPPDLEQMTVRYTLHLPDQDELEAVVTSVQRSLARPRAATTPAAPSRGAVESPGREDMTPIVRALQGLTLHQARQVVSHCVLEDGWLTEAAIHRILERKAQAIKEGGLLEYYPVDDNRFELGGFDQLKAWLERARVGFTPEAQALNLTPPRGILLVGVPGCGKSLAAKCIARQWQLPLLKLDAGRLFDKYVGESEKNFRKAIELAESLAPIVLWVDEIEKALATSGGGGDSDGGVSRRLFAAFLTWLQEKRLEVFVVATANDITVLPPELLRKGRFDEIFFVDLPAEDERGQIWTIHLQLRKQDPARFDGRRIVEASEGFSGSEIEQAVVAGLYRALHAGRPLDTAILLEELRQTVPLSVSRAEDISRLRALAANRFVPVRSRPRAPASASQTRPGPTS